MNNKQKFEMYKKIESHGNDLIKIFGVKNINPIELCKKLFKIEKKLHKIMVNLCNTNNINGIEPGYDLLGNWRQLETSEKEQEKIFETYKRKVYKILGEHNFIIFNHDPRGYALKIDDKYVKKNNLKIYQDMGGYGIIAPDFRN